MKKYTIGLFLLIVILIGSVWYVKKIAKDTSEQIAETNLIQEDSVELKPSVDTLSNLFQDSIEIAPISYRANETGYIEVNWKNLSYVEFRDEYHDSLETYIFYPIFHESIQKLNGKQVQISGYVIPIEETGDENILVLSAFTFSNCFFCGMAGPETIMDIKLKSKSKKRWKMDEQTTFRGKLRLNDTDLYYLNYILEEAEAVRD